MAGSCFCFVLALPFLIGAGAGVWAYLQSRHTLGAFFVVVGALMSTLIIRAVLRHFESDER